MERLYRGCETELLREGKLRIPSWAKAEQLERIIPQKDLWTPENLVRPDSKKEEYMEEKNKGIRKYQITALTAVLLFVAATFQIASDNVLLGVVFFGAASCFSSLAGVYREREMSEQIGAINHVENIN